MRTAHRLVIVSLVAWMALACVAAPKRPTVNVAQAQLYSAELTAAQTFHETTLTAAGNENRAGTLDGEALARLVTAGDALVAAMRNYSAELQLYLVTGVESDAFNDARSSVAKNKLALALLWEAVHRGDT